jgi:hypothetical protein
LLSKDVRTAHASDAMTVLKVDIYLLTGLMAVSQKLISKRAAPTFESGTGRWRQC